MKILVAYASISGNTSKVAQALADFIATSYSNHTVKLEDMVELSPNGALGYDLIFFGCSTWSDGEMNDVGLNFFDQVQAQNTDFQKVPCALFGLGDKRYENYCTSIPKMAEILKAHKAQILTDTLKVDGNPDEKTYQAAQAWAKKVISSL